MCVVVYCKCCSKKVHRNLCQILCFNLSEITVTCILCSGRWKYYSCVRSNCNIDVCEFSFMTYKIPYKTYINGELVHINKKESDDYILINEFNADIYFMLPIYVSAKDYFNNVINKLKLYE